MLNQLVVTVSALARCAHVSLLLLLSNTANKNEMIPLTSEECPWNKGKKTRQKANQANVSHQVKFDPRPED